VLCCAAEALHHALQQQTSLTISGCTTHLLTDPNPAADLAGLVPLPSGPAQAGPVPARALFPSLVMSSRGTALLVVSVQLKTGFLRLAAACGAAQDQDLLQQLKQVHSPSSCDRIVSKTCVSMEKVARGHPCFLTYPSVKCPDADKVRWNFLTMACQNTQSQSASFLTDLAIQRWHNRQHNVGKCIIFCCNYAKHSIYSHWSCLLQLCSLLSITVSLSTYCQCISGLQQENKLASLQKDMRFVPLEDPSLSRGVALSRALAQELSSLFLIVAQQACFAQLAAAAAQHGLTRSGLPQNLLSVSAVRRLSRHKTC